MKKLQNGSTVVGVIIGVVIGLAVALAVAVYVTKVPVPISSKSQPRTAEQDAAETRKNKDWDPNAALAGKNPARPASAASAAAPAGSAPAAAPGTAPVAAPTPGAPAAAVPAASAPARAASRAASSADPLGDFATAKAGAGADPFLYFVQAGAYRTTEDAEAQRAKLTLLGVETKVSEREQSGRQVFRVRAGPFERKEDADRQKDKLEAAGVEAALVRVQR